MDRFSPASLIDLAGMLGILALVALLYTQVILRSSRSMQNPMYPGREAVAIPRDKPLVLRYRLAVHRGDTAHADIEALQREYEAVEFE